MPNLSAITLTRSGLKVPSFIASKDGIKVAGAVQPDLLYVGAIVSSILTCIDEGDFALSSPLIGWQLACHSQSHRDLGLAGPASLRKGAVLSSFATAYWPSRL